MRSAANTCQLHSERCVKTLQGIEDRFSRPDDFWLLDSDVPVGPINTKGVPPDCATPLWGRPITNGVGQLGTMLLLFGLYLDHLHFIRSKKLNAILSRPFEGQDGSRPGINGAFDVPRQELRHEESPVV